MEKYTKYFTGPWLGPEENEKTTADYYAAVDAGARRVALIWSWCGGSQISHAVDARGRAWEERGGVRRRA